MISSPPVAFVASILAVKQQNGSLTSRSAMILSTLEVLLAILLVWALFTL